MTRFAVGIDGGGTGTRALLADANGNVLGRASAGPSALGLGVASAWAEIERATRAAFDEAGRDFSWGACTLCCGLSGVNNAAWRDAFVDAMPAGTTVVLVSDAYTTLWGAHQGRAGVIVALGTGSIAAALDAGAGAATEERIAGGYGFPSGDEASGAWLGLRAIVYLQQVMDGRRAADDFSEALRRQTGATTRDELVAWSCDANQTIFATLAPVVIEYGTHSGGDPEAQPGSADPGRTRPADPHPFARSLLEQAGVEIARMVDALDPDGMLPVALCGGLAAPLGPFVPARIAARVVPPAADSVGGALALALDRLGAHPATRVE